MSPSLPLQRSEPPRARGADTPIRLIRAWVGGGLTPLRFGVAMLALVTVCTITDVPSPVPASASASDSRTSDQRVRTNAPALGSTFLIGDSTTKRAAACLRERRPDWHLDYEGGRPVRALNSHIARYLRRVDSRPEVLIQALGSNRSPGIWSKGRLRRALAKLPDSTHVFLVLVVRAGRFQEWKDRVLRRYNRWSREISRERPRTYVIPWRRAVLRDSTLRKWSGRSSLLEDGTHQTGSPFGKRKAGPGVRTWVDLIERKYDRIIPPPTGDSVSGRLARSGPGSGPCGGSPT